MTDLSACIFCNIVRGELPNYTLYEDEDYLAFLDIFPRVKGHAIVIPKKHYRWVYDVPQFGEYWEIAKKVGEKIQKTLKAEYISFLTIGNEVPHAHIHVLPQWGDSLKGFAITPVIKMSTEEMSELARTISN
ncbi:MAG: HIT domain-containing protein [bacterium]|nr:HIT domain-containing protein [bacterium]